MIKIGYQGIEGSNSEEAAKVLAKQLNISQYELIPLVTSKNVICELNNHKINYGVVAISNSIGGIVKETKDAIKNIQLNIIATTTLQIHHCIFIKPNIQFQDIKYIASHPQALLQTKQNRLKYLNVIEKEVEDTAIAAKYLYEDKLSDDTAVICRKNAGELYKLKLIYENIEDRNDNFTKFQMVSI